MGMQHIDEIKALVQSGDVKLDEERARFKKVIGRDTTVDDEGVIEALAFEEDGPNDSVFVEKIIEIEGRLKPTEPAA